MTAWSILLVRELLLTAVLPAPLTAMVPATGRVTTADAAEARVAKDDAVDCSCRASLSNLILALLLLVLVLYVLTPAVVELELL